MRNERSGHACLIYRTRSEHAQTLGAFIEEGLARGERCLYIVHYHQPGEVLRMLRERGVDVDRAIERGALVVRGQRETYLQKASFDAARMLAFLADAAKEAREAGFTGLRATGEMTWAAGTHPGPEALLQYEELLDSFTREHGIVGLCQYHADSFAPEVIEGVRRTHGRIVEPGKGVA